MDNEFRKFDDFADLLKVLAHPVRLCIVSGLIDKESCNVSYMHSCLKLPQSTVSQHLQKLKSAGIVVGERNGLEINYKISNKQVIDLINIFLKN